MRSRIGTDRTADSGTGGGQGGGDGAWVVAAVGAGWGRARFSAVQTDTQQDPTGHHQGDRTGHEHPWRRPTVGRARSSPASGPRGVRVATAGHPGQEAEAAEQAQPTQQDQGSDGRMSGSTATGVGEPAGRRRPRSPHPRWRRRRYRRYR